MLRRKAKINIMSEDGVIPSHLVGAAQIEFCSYAALSDEYISCVFGDLRTAEKFAVAYRTAVAFLPSEVAYI